MKKEYLKQNPKTRKRLKIIGAILLTIGIFLSVFGISTSLMEFGFGNSWMVFLGFPMIFAGSVCLSYGYMGQVARYTSSELSPVAKDTINYMIDGTKDEILDFVEGIKGGKRYCPNCGDEVKQDEIFCDKCGKKLRCECVKCGTENDADSSYCKKCGNKL